MKNRRDGWALGVGGAIALALTACGAEGPYPPGGPVDGLSWGDTDLAVEVFPTTLDPEGTHVWYYVEGDRVQPVNKYSPVDPAPPVMVLNAWGAGKTRYWKTWRPRSVLLDHFGAASQSVLPEFWGWFSMSSLVDDPADVVCINLLSTIIQPRTLTSEAWELGDRSLALEQTSSELLAALGIPQDEALKFNDACLSDGDTEAARIMLGMSYVLLQAYGVLDDGKFVDESERFYVSMNNIIADFTADGLLDADTVAFLKYAARTLDGPALEADLRTRLEAVDAPFEVAKFSEFLDEFSSSDGDGGGGEELP